MANILYVMLESTKKFSIISVYFALTLSTLLVFWQVRNFDFVNYDDNGYVYENPQVLNGLTVDSIVWAFTTPHIGNWLPLTWLSFMLDCQFYGPNPGWMHLENVLLHVLNTLLLFAVLKKMTGSLWSSAFVAAAFALHPMHVESVAWITERKDVLSTLFMFLTLAAYVGYVGHRSLFRYLLTVLLFALGLLAKPMLVTLPFVLLLLDYWPLNRLTPQTANRSRKDAPASVERRSWRWIIIEKIPFFALAAVSSVITFWVQRSSGAVPDIINLPLKSRIANAFLSYAKYMGKMFWPDSLAVVYPFKSGSISLWQVALCVFLLLVITVFVIRFRRNQKYLPVGWFWFLGTLIPVIGLVQSGTQAYADRYTYVSYIGLFIMLAWGMPELLSKWRHRKIALGILMVIVLIALGIRADRQTSYWASSFTLFSHALDVTRDNDIAHDCLADDLLKQGKNALAIEHCTKAIQINPNDAIAAHGIGCALLGEGNTIQAIEYLQKAIQLKPDYAAAHNSLGVALGKQGRLAEATAHFAQAIQLMPDYAEARYNLANELRVQGRCDEALEQYHVVLQLRPDWPELLNNSAWLIATHPEIKNRDVNEAIHLARRGCELTNYKNPPFVGTLAAAYASAGKFPEAIDTAQKAVALANAGNLPQIKNILQYHLTLYTNGKPYIEPPPKPITETNKP